jgi:exopolyphosphatase/guanosine-5'-triphosphate,3'-diphosphate pyrophosphatase
LSQPEIVINELPANEFEHIAALDLGSNSFHLVVTRIVNGSVQIVHRVKQRVELAHGLDDNYTLSPEAIDRGLTALKLMQESLQGFAPEKVRNVYTYK